MPKPRALSDQVRDAMRAIADEATAQGSHREADAINAAAGQITAERALRLRRLLR